MHSIFRPVDFKRIFCVPWWNTNLGLMPLTLGHRSLPFTKGGRGGSIASGLKSP
jgi:hypothetical protein